MINRELKINLKSLILWVVIIVAMYVLVFAIYPRLMTDETKQSLDIMVKSMPKEMISSFNMDIVSMESAYGWFKTEGLVFLLLLGGIYSAILGSTTLLKEENDKTIEFLYSKPVTRNKIITSKIICNVLYILAFTALVTLANMIALLISDALDIKEFLMISLIPLLLYYMLFFICLFLSTFMKKTKKSMSMGIVIVFVAYFMQLIGNMGKSVEIIKQLSLFEFVSSRYIILNNSLDTKYIFIGLIIIAVTCIGTYIHYNKKELV